MRWVILGVALCGASELVAQRRAAPPPPKRLFVDSVVASVNDSAILQSKLFATASGSILGAEAQAGRPLAREEIEQMITRDLRSLISDYQMAQAARSFGNLPPDRFDMILESQLEQDKEDRRRDLGGWGELSAELERTGQTWRTYADSQRMEKLQMLAEQFSIYERLRKQSNLYLTPRMLRDTYAQYRDQFVRKAMAQVSMVTFRGPDAAKRAKEASDVWADQVLTARELADRFGPATPLLSMRAKSLQPRIRDFALQGPVGNVSDPIPRSNGLVDVVKVMQFLPARDGKFTDPDVQADIRRIASDQVLREFREQALNRARQRTEVWIYQNGRRVRIK
ncbi:MAG: peptidylprolyl isomerase [Planctomycetota bacterium]|nr:peptidylprolyl isomerase [Planctomycetota bacterium]MEC9047723.1 peptidylprolyl isomerase [Planctomycetota bacterium]